MHEIAKLNYRVITFSVIVGIIIRYNNVKVKREKKF